MEGHKPGSDPRYSCGWHNRKNTFNKERRQFEKMSSFETQAAGLARPGFSGPQLPIPPPEDPEILGRSPPHPHPTALPASGARGTRTGDPSSAAAYFGVTPPGLSSPPRRTGLQGRGSLRSRGSQARGAWPVACVCGMRAGNARAGECRAPTPVWAPARSRAPRSPLSRFSARAPTELRQGTS